MEQSGLFYVFGSIPVALVCVVSGGILLLYPAWKRAGRNCSALRVLIYCVAMLYLLLFTVLAVVCVYKVLEFYQGLWAAPWIALLLVGEVAVLGWFVYRNTMVFPVLKQSGASGCGAEDSVDPVVDQGQESTEEWISRRLSELFEKERIYREFELHIEDVAMRIGTNRTYLSRVLNQKFGYNFFRFVNYYRLEEAKELLLSTSLEICRIANQVGYKNINTFNACFREHFGVSPKQWKKANLEVPRVNL